MKKDISIKNFSFAYTNDYVLKDITIDVFKGECVGLIGSNGSGKTTLINCILGELNGSGYVSVLEMTPCIYSISFKKKIGIIPDNDLLADYLTLYEYLYFVCRLYDIPDNEIENSINHWITFFKLQDYKNRLLKYFSHGMRKKVQIMSAIIHKPQLLIIDEPTNGLDIEMIIQLKKVILCLKQEGITILISTHILDFVENTCDKVAIINNGSIQKFFSLKELEENQTLESFFIQTIQ